MTDSHRLAQGRARVRSVAVTATGASILAAAGIAFALPGVTATKATTSAGSTGQNSTSHQPAAHKRAVSREHHTSSRSTGLKSPTAAPTSSSNAPQVSSGGS